MGAVENHGDWIDGANIKRVGDFYLPDLLCIGAKDITAVDNPGVGFVCTPYKAAKAAA